MKVRYLQSQVLADLKRKMVFVAGPRQVGKTTLAKKLLSKQSNGYLNWDIPAHREAILKQQLPNASMWVFDEIHKYRQWRNFLKGLYDEFHADHQILVTGSARLDYYRRGGDSLQGRYHHLRLHPLSTAELGIKNTDDFNTLYQLGGFPEPFFSGNATQAKRWSREYRQRLIHDDLTSLEHIKDLSKIELLMLRLPELVGSPLSLNALKDDLQTSQPSIANWVQILENLYSIFRLPPFGAPQIRAIKKQQKHYHFDWTLVQNDGARFENLVASHLLKWVHFQQDTLGKDVELRYFRDNEGREVDFIVVENAEPIWAIECKLKQSEVSKHLHYFTKHFPNCQGVQLHLHGEKDYITQERIRVCNALTWLANLV